MNSRRKGKVGEREFASVLRENGFDARRGQQFCGGADSPDVMSEALRWLHIEVKRVQNLNLTDACIQAQCDCCGKPWIVAHRRNHAPWFITMKAEFFFELIREFEPVAAPQAINAEAEADSSRAKDAKKLEGRTSEPDLITTAISAATCVAANNDNNPKTERLNK
jgi:hypothetical protein